jgi:hypothetical protein
MQRRTSPWLLHGSNFTEFSYPNHSGVEGPMLELLLRLVALLGRKIFASHLSRAELEPLIAKDEGFLWFKLDKHEHAYTKLHSAPLTQLFPPTAALSKSSIFIANSRWLLR